MLDNHTKPGAFGLGIIARNSLLAVGILALAGCGVKNNNEFLEMPENIIDTSAEDNDGPLGEIVDLTLDDVTVRGRPHIDKSLGYNVIRTDLNTALRGVSLSFDGGDPYGSIEANMPTAAQMESLVNDYGFNTVHVYLEGDAAQNPDPAGINEALADELVQLTRDAKMYLIITMGNNGENGAIHSMEKTLAFWELYGAKYADETHVIFEAHNEPVSGVNGNWTSVDWARQADMYRTIRSVAPDTMVLLGSFMSFFGGSQAIAGADGLAEEFPGIWNNAGFAFHAYWNLPEVESTIAAFETSTKYPALMCTEFHPGDTKNGYNEVFESHHIGWTQFEWLGANDLELDRFKGYLDSYGTTWRPENPTTTWPANGSPTIAFDQTIGLYSRADEAFLRLDEFLQVIADDRDYDGIGGDEFVVIDAGDDGSVALRASNGKYLTVSDYGQPLLATANKIGVNQKFKWLELPSGDIALRPWSGSAHLIGTLPATDGENYGMTGVIGEGVERNGANTYRVAISHTSSVAPLEDLPEIPPGPFHGSPMPVPTNGEGEHALDSLAPNGRLWASDYDYGGEGVAYHDDGAVNLGEAYRADEAVDVQSSGEGYTTVGFFETDEWLEYSIDVAVAGNYQITYRTASGSGVGGSISFESDCVKLTGDLATPNTNGWDTYQDQTVDVTLKAGVQKLRVVSGGNMNLMNMDIQPGGQGGSAYGAGCEWIPPEPDDIFVEAEEWIDVIGSPDGTVSIGATTDSDLSDFVGNFDEDDFIEYAIEVPADACYIAEYRVASESGSLGFELSFDGEVKDSFAVPRTGGWTSWVTFQSGIELSEGAQTLRLEALGDSFNINWFKFNQADPEQCLDDGAITIEAEGYNNSIPLIDGNTVVGIGTEGTQDEGGGLNVGWIDAGDWMEYAFTVVEDGNYQVSFRAASRSGSNPGINFYLDGTLLLTAAVGSTGDWQNWQTFSGAVVSLVAGDYVLRLETPSGGFNLNWFKFTPTDEPAGPAPEPPTTPVPDGTFSMFSLETDGMLEARATDIANTPGLADGLANPAAGSSLSFHGDNLSGNDSWKLNIGEWYGGSTGNYGMTLGMMVFQIPNFGEVSDPFLTAEFEVLLDQKGDALDFTADLWAVRSSDSPDLLLSDWYIGPDTGVAAAGSLIQSSYLTPDTELGMVTTSADANQQLIDYLNARYDGGNGVGDYVFFRVNRGDENAFVNGWNAYVLKSSQSEAGEAESPEIRYTSTVDPIAEPGTDPGTDPGTGTDPDPVTDPNNIVIEAESHTAVIGEVTNETTTDEGGGQNVGFIDAGDVMTYEITVPADGNYRVTYRVASQSGSLPGLRLYVDDVWVDAAGLSSTGGWQNWQTVTGRTVALVAGSRSISIEAKSGGFNLNWIGLTLTDAAADAAPVEPAPEPAVTYTVSAIGATSVSMHSSAFSWNLANVLAAVDNGDGTWTATIDPGLSQGMEYKWIVDGTEEDFSAAYNAGDCAFDNVVAYDNTWFNRTWAYGAGNVTGDVAGVCNGTGTGDIGTGSDTVLNIGETISFNDPIVDYALVDSGDNTSQVTADPQDIDNSVVSSSKVSDLNAGTTLASGTITYPLTDTLTRLSMRVYSPLVGVPVRIKLEESGNASHSVEAEMLTTVADQWEVIIFDFSNHVAGTAALDTSYSYDSLSVYFDYGSAGNGETYYWDDITFLDVPLSPPNPEGTFSMFSLENDGMLEARATDINSTPGLADGVANPAAGSSLSFHGDNLSGNDSWKLNIGEWYGGAPGNYGMTLGMMVFQIPNFGEVDNPFLSAELEVILEQKGDALDFAADLWAVRTSDSPSLLLSDWYIGPDTGNAAAGTLIQSSYLSPENELGLVTTSADANQQLIDYLNARYDGGNGVGDYVFFRVNKGDENAFVNGWNAYVLKSSQSDAGMDGAPEIRYTSTVDPMAIPDTVPPEEPPEEPPVEPPVTTGDNLLAYGDVDDGTGWTVINHYEAANTMGDVNFVNGVAMLVETDTFTPGSWKHIGLYTSVFLQPGTYQFDMTVVYANASDAWGEVYIGASEPVAGTEYNGDQQVIKVFNTWDCTDRVTYSGFATASGCDGSTNPGQFQITTAGTYYLLFRSGGASYGAFGIVTDNYSIKAVE